MKNNTILLFFAGVGVGYGACYLVMKARFEKVLDERVDAINQAFDKEMKELGLEVVPVESPDKKPSTDTKIFRSEIKKHNYDSFYEAREKVEEEVEEKDENDGGPKEGGFVEPYIITAQQFATDGILDKVTLTYYINADLVCEEEEAVDDPEAVIGTEFTDHFHDDEEGVVYVRNEKLGTDYEVILDDSDGEFIRARFGFTT